jgi:hypothetical protein
MSLDHSSTVVCNRMVIAGCLCDRVRIFYVSGGILFCRNACSYACSATYA